MKKYLFVVVVLVVVGFVVFTEQGNEDYKRFLNSVSSYISKFYFK